MASHDTPASIRPNPRHSCEGLSASGVAGIQNTRSTRAVQTRDSRIDKEDIDSARVSTLVCCHEAAIPALPNEVGIDLK